MLGPSPEGRSGEFASVHAARHDDVGEQQVDVLAAVDYGQRFGAVARRQGSVAEALDLGQDVLTDQRIVLHHQDRFAAALGVAAALDDGCRRATADACGRYSFTVVPWPTSL